MDRLKADFETVEINLKERLNKLEANKHLLEDVIEFKLISLNSLIIDF